MHVFVPTSITIKEIYAYKHTWCQPRLFVICFILHEMLIISYVSVYITNAGMIHVMQSLLLMSYLPLFIRAPLQWQATV